MATTPVFKIVLLGDSSVGKSSVLQRFAQNTFAHSYLSTIGVDFQQRDIFVNGSTVRLQIFDTAGQERFDTISKAYYRGADGLLLFYDITLQESLLHIRKWVKNSESEAGSAVRILVGNKCDLEKQRAVTKDEVKNLSVELGLACFETSALTGLNVEEVFFSLAKHIITKLPTERSKKNTIHLAQSTVVTNNNKPKKCC